MKWENLQDLCNRYGWLTEGTNEQILKIKDVLEYCTRYGQDIERLAWLIWLCSDMRGKELTIGRWMDNIRKALLAEQSALEAKETLKNLKEHERLKEHELGKN